MNIEIEKLSITVGQLKQFSFNQYLFLINDEQINAFNKAIELSFNNNDKVQALLDRKSPWE